MPPDLNSPSISTIGDNRQTVTTPGVAVAIAASTPIREVTFTAETDNTNIVVIGGSTVVAALATRRGTPLFPGDSVTFQGNDLADFYLDAITATEGVSYTHLA